MQEQEPPRPQRFAAPQRRIADMDVPTFFVLLLVTVAVAVVLGGYIFYYVVMRALGTGA
jgi:hypothetical protein